MEDDKQCKPRRSIKNGAVTNTPTRNGMIAQYTCNQHYRLKGEFYVPHNALHTEPDSCIFRIFYYLLYSFLFSFRSAFFLYNVGIPMSFILKHFVEIYRLLGIQFFLAGNFIN